MTDWDRPARDDYEDWKESVDRDWARVERFEREDELSEKGGEDVEPLGGGEE